jgi:hypothetical protein
MKGGKVPVRRAARLALQHVLRRCEGRRGPSLRLLCQAVSKNVRLLNQEWKGKLIMKRLALLLVFLLFAATPPLVAQQKGQYVPGQYGLNAGVLPDPGFTYANIDLNYDTNSFNNSSGTAVPPKPRLNLWVIENIYFYVVDTKFLGGNIGFMAIIPTLANGSLTLEQVNVSGSSYGLADSWFQPFTLGWHLKRADIQVADAFVTPTGRYSPGATNNIGSGYFGNHLTTGTTVYLTKNKGTSANLFTDWEVHGQRQGTNGTYKTPGQALTDEWGLGQALPLSKDMSKLIQLGVIGYDQWQVTDNSGNVSTTLPNGTVVIAPASLLPRYSVHAVGGQANFIMPPKNIILYFKYEHEYTAYAHTLGNTIVFGGSWTLKIP